MTLETLQELFSKETPNSIPITHRRVAIFQTISASLTDSDKLILTYNAKNDQVKVQLNELIEVFELATLEPWLLRQRIMSLALETSVDLATIDQLTKTWEGF